jgi:hypothetical protein
MRRILKSRCAVVRFCFTALAIFISVCTTPSAAASEVLEPSGAVILGAGLPPPWVTEYVISNDQPDTVRAIIALYPGMSICPDPCPNFKMVQLPANGTVTTFGPAGGFPRLLVVGGETDKMPAFRVRTYNVENPTQAVDLPIFRFSTIFASNPDKLVFGIRPQATRTNLLLANIALPSGGNEVTLQIDVFSSDGRPLSSRDVIVAPNEQIYIVDIGRYLGIPNPAPGQVRVTRVGGTGVFWGISPSVNADGTISITLGQIP